MTTLTHFYDITKWFNIAIFIHKKIPKKNLNGNLYMANIICKSWKGVKVEVKKNNYWNCCLKPSQGFGLQIELQPTSLQYPLINYPAPEQDDNIDTTNEANIMQEEDEEPSIVIRRRRRRPMRQPPNMSHLGYKFSKILKNWISIWFGRLKS